MRALSISEAKTKWCPFARASDGQESPSAINRTRAGSDPDCLCVGSECMAWRVAQFRNGAERGDGSGYCGLAGKVGAD